MRRIALAVAALLLLAACGPAPETASQGIDPEPVIDAAPAPPSPDSPNRLLPPPGGSKGEPEAEGVAAEPEVASPVATVYFIHTDW